MEIKFDKYQGNGNDFIIIDDRMNRFNDDASIVNRLCDRHFGIGADGLMLVRESETADFEMLYYNSDGALSTMCGNGGRCIAAFCYEHGIAGKKMRFSAVDGFHHAVIENKLKEGYYDVSLEMIDVEKVERRKNHFFLDTGSPHHVEFVQDLKDLNVYENGKKIRYSSAYEPDGTNVNFVEVFDDHIFVRTYERGVENETLSCGTGVTASAIATFLKTGKKDFSIETPGGQFSVDFQFDNNLFHNVWLRGPAVKVFTGEINL
jgi:diaminopimelate epimerase